MRDLWVMFKIYFASVKNDKIRKISVIKPAISGFTFVQVVSIWGYHKFCPPLGIFIIHEILMNLCYWQAMQKIQINIKHSLNKKILFWTQSPLFLLEIRCYGEIFLVNQEQHDSMASNLCEQLDLTINGDVALMTKKHEGLLFVCFWVLRGHYFGYM